MNIVSVRMRYNGISIVLMGIQGPAGGGGGGGSGTVTSFSATPSSVFNVANATTTPALSMDDQPANRFLGGPTTGSDAPPGFRAIVAADLPATAVTAGSYGSASAVATFTADAAGRLTAAGSTSIAIAQLAVTNLVSDLALKAPLASPALTGTPTAPTAADGTNTTQLATTQFTQTAVNNAISDLVNGASSALDTLAELAAALGGDANYASTTAAALGNRVRVDAAQSFSSGQQTQGLQNLGLTTVGIAIAKLTNPSAVTFLRINADNSVTARSAANFVDDIGGASSTGSGGLARISGGTLRGSVTVQASVDIASPIVLNGETAEGNFPGGLKAGGGGFSVDVSGNVEAANLEGTNTGDQTTLPLAALPASDDTYNGNVITGRNAGATIAQWEAVYLGSGGTWLLADANGSGTYPAVGLAVAAYSSGNAAIVLTFGVARNDTWNWTVGGLVYLSATAGGLTQTAPSTSGDKVQVFGVALSADSIFVRPSLDYLTIA